MMRSCAVFRVGVTCILAAACGEPVESSPEQELLATSAAFEAGTVGFQAANGQWVVAEGGGGGVVNANRTAAGPWESFTLEDANGGALVSGDAIAIRTYDGHYLVAEGGGGSSLRARSGAV